MSKRIRVTLDLTPAQLVDLEVGTRLRKEAIWDCLDDGTSVYTKRDLDRVTKLNFMFANLRATHGI